jgi:hypothetical protein
MLVVIGDGRSEGLIMFCRHFRCDQGKMVEAGRGSRREGDVSQSAGNHNMSSNFPCVECLCSRYAVENQSPLAW